MSVQAVLLDLEGTVSSRSFVSDTLVPWAVRKAKTFLEKHAGDGETAEALASLRLDVAGETGADPASLRHAELAETIAEWLRQGRKNTGLKILLGLLVEEGYAKGAFQGHVYPDVAKALAAWKKEGLKLAVFSSESEHSQRLLFKNSEAGDLTPHVDRFFDTRAGGKLDSAAYLGIAESLGVAPESLLFLSDSEEELDEARLVGCRTTQLVRSGNRAGTRHPLVPSFQHVAPSKL